MPISDLLASITGEKPVPSPTTSIKPSLTVPKRKAEEDIRPASSKAARTEPLANGSSRQNGDSQKASPRPADRPARSLTEKPASTTRPAARPANPQISKSSSATPSRIVGVRAPSSTNGNGTNPLPSRPLAAQPLASGSGTPSEPRKRSFKETMARAEANATAREFFGKIQHKPLGKASTTKERKELKAEEARLGKKSTRQQQHGGRAGGSAAPSRNGTGNASERHGGMSRTPSVHAKSSPAPVAEEKKKAKKAALATTGYTGTARPRPGATTAKAGVPSRPSTTARPDERARYGGPSISRRYDHDEDLDDFIDYDDEEDEPAYGVRRGGYESEEYDSDDMEVGLGDIDEEERKAEYLARREDMEQEALEKRLKREKEERRQKQLDLIRNKTAKR
ncbi:hypothetical protein B0T22DRAFT_451183 [Podospora appendiculata]|uniref:SPT2 chromatin protein n=1 Tax=Podospora appendiculata TaxID=314037 RepID=A0AAE1CGQ4_9PEZI|nr:hypothetical protein B0T22DRAFT_451183 [Podospora appendiculata]